jgi:hypothetical protein
MAIIRIVRQLVYEGEEAWLRAVMDQSRIKPDEIFRIEGSGTIRESMRFETESEDSVAGDSYKPENDPDNIVPVNRFIVRRDGDLVGVYVQVADAGLIDICKFHVLPQVPGIDPSFFRGIIAAELQEKIAKSKSQILDKDIAGIKTGSADL